MMKEREERRSKKKQEGGGGRGGGGGGEGEKEKKEARKRIKSLECEKKVVKFFRGHDFHPWGHRGVAPTLPLHYHHPFQFITLSLSLSSYVITPVTSIATLP